MVDMSLKLASWVCFSLLCCSHTAHTTTRGRTLSSPRTSGATFLADCSLPLLEGSFVPTPDSQAACCQPPSWLPCLPRSPALQAQQVCLNHSGSVGPPSHATLRVPFHLDLGANWKEECLKELHFCPSWFPSGGTQSAQCLSPGLAQIRVKRGPCPTPGEPSLP